MTDREVMQMALDIILRYRKETPLGNQPHMIALVADDTIKALRAALAQPEPEPVAYLTKRKLSGTEGLLRADMMDMSAKNKETHDFIPLYTTLPQRNALSDEEMIEIMESCTYDGGKVSWNLFGKAIEAAHGIG